MTNSTLFSLFLSQFIVQAPVLLVCLVGMLVVVAWWRRLATGAPWALLSFILAFFFALLVPVGQAATQIWLMHQGDTMAQVGWWLGLVSFGWSVLHALTYVFFLVAILAGRAPVLPRPGIPIGRSANLG